MPCFRVTSRRHSARSKTSERRPAEKSGRTLQANLTDVNFARGPQYLSEITAPSGIEESTRSASSVASRNRPDQVSVIPIVNPLISLEHFRELLIARDSTCPVSGNWPADCQAAYIVPASRPDVGSAVDYILTRYSRVAIMLGRSQLPLGLSANCCSSSILQAGHSDLSSRKA